ncbi:MAG: hypothetical protein R3C61_13230 [Bacteroidia bacterium]
MNRTPLFRILFFLSVFMAGMVFHSQAQRIYEEDVIYLKNGSVIRGQIAEQKIGEYVTIDLVGETTMTFQTSEIEKITREPAKYSYIKLKLRNIYRPISYRQNGLYGMLSFGLGFSEGRWGPEGYPTLQLRGGYHFHRLLNVGLGTGLDVYSRGSVTPIYLDVHGEIVEKRIAPHYFVNVGYGNGTFPGWNTRVFTGGLMGHAGLGLKLNTRSRNEWFFTIGYKFQHTYMEFEDWDIVWLNWDWSTGNGPNVTDAPIVKGTILYQKIIWQISWGF